MATEHSPEHELAAIWLIAARTMVAARTCTPRADNAAGGLYAQAILGLSEESCLAVKGSEGFAHMTLVDCLGGLRTLPREQAEKILTGVMMIAYANRRMEPREVRWASSLASAAGISPDEFQRCCASARVIASMLQPEAAEPAA